MRLSVLLLAGWFLLATTSYAHADPVSAIVGIISAVAKVGTIGQLIIGVALKAGMSLLSRARSKREEQRPAGVKGSMTVGGDNPMSFIIGTYATAGQLEYVNSYGKAGKTPNAYLVQVVSLSDLPVSAMSSSVWINGEKCTIDWNAAPTDAGYPVLQYRQNGTDHLWVRFRDGTQTAVDPYLLNTFGGDATRPWLADMIGRGVAYAIVTARVNREVMTSPPRCKFVLQGIKLYDIRKDSSAGGSGPHRWSDPSTWEWSDNTKVAQYNLLRGLSYNGEWFYGGQNLAAFQLPASNWMAAMNECDRQVAVAAGGTEKQFRCGAEIALNYQPLEAIKELDKSCNGRTAELGGIYKTICGMPGLPVYSFTDEDIVITSEQQQDPFPSHQQTYNGAHASYPEPAEDWAMKDAPPRYNATYEAADDGQRLVADLSYPMVPYGTQVQRLMYAAIEEERRFNSQTGTLPPEAWLLEPLDTIAWSSARNGYDGKLFLLGDMDDLPGVNQVVAFRELDPLDYSWSSDKELPTSVGPTGPIVPPPQPMTGWAVEPAEVTDATGAARRPAIKIRCAADLDDVARIHVIVRVKATGAIVFDSDQTPYPRPDSGAAYEWVLSGAWCVPNTLYQAQGVYVPYSTRIMEPSAWLDVLTRNIMQTDINVEMAQIGQSVSNRLKELQREMDEFFRPTIEQLLTAFSLEGAVGEVQRQKLRAEMGDALAQIVQEARVRASDDEALAQLITIVSASVGNAMARIITEETARANADGALASSITGVSADFNGRFAQGLVKFEAVAAPAGVDARFSVMLRGGTAATYKESGFYIELVTEGAVQKSRMAINVDQFVVTDGTNSTAPMVFQGGVLKLINAVIQQAQIENLQVGTSNIVPGAVTRAAYTNNADSVVVGSLGNYLTMAEITINHGLSSPPVFVAASLVGSNSWGLTSTAVGGWAAIRLTNVTESYDLVNTRFNEAQGDKGLPSGRSWSHSQNFQPAAGTASTLLRLQAGQSAGGDNRVQVRERTLTAMALIRS